MIFQTDYRVERYALETKWDDFPEDVKERALRCAIDLFGALILGSRGEQFRAGERFASLCGMAGELAVIGSEKRYNLLGASVVAAHASNSFDIDDGYNMIKGHPGASFVGGVLAAAQERDHSCRELLETLVVCYELTIRWALAMQEHYGYLHSTGCYGAFGTAVGIGRLLGLSPEELNRALSCADFHAPLTPVMRSVEIPSMNKDGVPFGSLVGAAAVLDTMCGETAKTHLLEAPEYRALVDSLGSRYYIRELYFKPYTCCRWAHQPILACQTLMRRFGFDYTQVREVCVHTFRAAAALSKKIPLDTDEAQYNIAYPVAAALVHGDVGYRQICDEAIRDRLVIDMMGRLRFTVDEAMEAQFPEKRLAWVEITLDDGRTLRSEVFAAPGEHTDPELGLDWIVRKFKRVTAPILCEEGQDAVLSLLSRADDTPVREILGEVNRCLLSRQGGM